MNVVDAKPVLKKAKEKKQVYYKSDTHFNQLGAFLTVQALKDKMDGKDESINKVKFDVTNKHYSGDLASLCGMQDTFNEDKMYELNSSSVDTKIKSDKRVLVIGDSFSEQMKSIMSQYFAEVRTVGVWSFDASVLNEFHPDIVVWENAERYTDRFYWISLFE